VDHCSGEIRPQQTLEGRASRRLEGRARSEPASDVLGQARPASRIVVHRFSRHTECGRSSTPWTSALAVRHPFLQAPVDGADLLGPVAAIAVLQLEDVRERPVEVVGDEGYLLVELFEGVANNSPGASDSRSSSKRVAHDGHVAATRVWAFSLMRRYRSWR